MSRIQDALKRAEEQRSGRLPSDPAPQPGDTNSEILDEVRRLEASLASWRAPATAAQAAPANPEEATQPAATPAAGRWQEDMRRCEAELSAQEGRVARLQGQRNVLQARVAEQDLAVSKAAAVLATLQRQLQESDMAVRRTQADQTILAERLTALRQCQALSTAAEEAERNFQAHATTIARISRVQQRVNERLSKHQLQAQQLQQAAAQLRRQLNEAVAQATNQTTQEGGRHE